MKEWGRDKTPTRLSKMAWSLASFASNRMHLADLKRGPLFCRYWPKPDILIAWANVRYWG
jgi:hypothetical protein